MQDDGYRNKKGGAPMSVQVKICGLKRPEDVLAVNEAKADYAGFVFFEKSKRNISFETAATLLSLLDSGIRPVAVCVCPDIELIRTVSGLGFDIIQIHGDISDGILDQIQTPVWQAVNLKKGMDPDLILSHPKICAYVVDGAEYGGGKTFGWDGDPALKERSENLSGKGNSDAGMNSESAGNFSGGNCGCEIHTGMEATIEKPPGLTSEQTIRQALHGQKFILAGGLTIDNVAQGIALFHPDIVDVSSGVETNGVKDSTLIHKFIRKVREQ